MHYNKNINNIIKILKANKKIIDYNINMNRFNKLCKKNIKKYYYLISPPITIFDSVFKIQFPSLFLPLFVGLSTTTIATIKKNNKPFNVKPNLTTSIIRKILF